jgi:NAD(P)-dependent dehydrogenase (short-subunit alcohol dehydrogenase family)
MKLNGKVAVITGAGSGMGKASAKLFAKEGAKIVVADVKPDAGQEVVKQIRQEGGEAIFVRTDVSLAADTENMIQTAVKSYGRLDILFNNAGLPGEKFEDTTEGKWRRLVDVNLTGPFLACIYAVPIMKKQGTGNILSTASVGAFKASGRSTAYNITKGGLIMLTKELALSLAKFNIRVNCICPGSVDTGLTDAFMNYPKTEEERRVRQASRLAQIPMGRAASPEEIASVALFLVSDDSSYITGVALPVDGGKLA